MAETKTRPTGANVDAYLASKASSEQLADCKAIMAMCKRGYEAAAKDVGAKHPRIDSSTQEAFRRTYAEINGALSGDGAIDKSRERK